MGQGLQIPPTSCQQEKQVSQIWSAACRWESQPIRGRDTQPTLPPVTPDHRATSLGPLSPCPSDHRKCQQSESQENSPPVQSKGAGCRQRGVPPGGPYLSEHSPGGAGAGWAHREGKLSGGRGQEEEGRPPPQTQESYRGPPPPGRPVSPPHTPPTTLPPPSASLLSSQGQFRLQLYSLRRLEPGWEAPLRLGTWHQAPGTRSLCLRQLVPPPRAPEAGSRRSWVLLAPQRSSWPSPRPCGPLSLSSCSRHSSLLLP